MYLIFKNKIIEANINENMFATIIGKFLSKIPYESHKINPNTNMIYINNEISFVCRVLITFTACGIKALVVSVAANKPIIVSRFI